MQYKRSHLSNGIEYILAPMKETKSLCILVMVRTGSRNEPKKLSGISHLLEHMTFKGTEKRPTMLAISQELDSLGSDYNAFTSKDFTGYYIKSSLDHAKNMLDIISDITLHAKLDQEEIEKERGTIFEEINLYEDTPSSLSSDVFDELLFGENSLGRRVLGTKESLLNISQKELSNYRYTQYVPKNLVVAVAGGFIQSKMKKLLESYLGNEKLFQKEQLMSSKNFTKISICQSRPRVRLQFKKTEQAHIVLGFPGLTSNDKNMPALNLLNVILGGNMSSRLFINIRERQGLCYYIHSGGESYEDVGSWEIQAGLDLKRIDLGITSILHELEGICQVGVTEKELMKAKEYINGKTVLGLEDSNSVAHYFALQRMKNLKIKTPEERLKEMKKVTLDDIQNVTKRILKKKFLNLAIIGPFKEPKRFHKLFSDVDL